MHYLLHGGVLLLASSFAPVYGADTIAFSSLCQSIGAGGNGTAAISVPDGYWTAAATAAELTPTSRFYPCINPDACLPSSASSANGGETPSNDGHPLVRCNEDDGYKAGGVLCGECSAPNHVQVGTRCARCMMPLSANVVAICGVAIVVVIFLFVLAWVSVGRENTNTTIVWRIFLNWATALSSLSDFVLRAPRRVLCLAGARRSLLRNT